MAYPKEFSEGMALLEASYKKNGKAPMTIFKEIEALLFRFNHVEIRKLHHKRIMVHSKNRGTLGLNPYQAHSTGGKIKTCGADLKQLHGAWAAELPPLGTHERCLRLTSMRS